MSKGLDGKEASQSFCQVEISEVALSRLAWVTGNTKTVSPTVNLCSCKRVGRQCVVKQELYETKKKNDIREKGRSMLVEVSLI